MTQLVTGEAVVLDLRTAGVPSRILATLLDLVVQWLGLAVLLVVLSSVAGGASSATVDALSVVVVVVALLGYPVAMETLSRGRTLGKLAMGLRVVRDDGGPIGFRQALTRGLVGLFAEKPGLTLGSAAVICALSNERSKRLGDLLAGTVVVQERVVRTGTGPLPMPPALAAWAGTLDLSGLPDALAASAGAFLSRHGTLSESARADLGARYAGAVAAVVAPAPPPGVPAWAYLAAVLAERRRRAALGTPDAGAPAVPRLDAPPVAPPPVVTPPSPVPDADAAESQTGPFVPPS